eukprot:4896055-Pleurochrysis_carterae.AAC.5
MLGRRKEAACVKVSNRGARRRLGFIARVSARYGGLSPGQVWPRWCHCEARLVAEHVALGVVERYRLGHGLRMA